MKKLLIPLLLFMGVHELKAQADPKHGTLGNLKQAVEKNISDFGGFPNDGIDDSRAFALAARFFSNRNLDLIDDGDDDVAKLLYYTTLLPSNALNIDYSTQYGVLNLKAGVYDVGEEIIDPSSTGDYFIYPKYFSKYDNNIDGLIIKGAGINATIIKHKAGYFGWFNPNNFQPANQAAGGKGTKMGAIFRNDASTKNIVIQDLKLDGNSDHYIVGSRFTNSGDFNVIDYGLLLEGQFITVENVDIVNFGCDGINFAISNNDPPVGRYNIVMNNVLSRWNGRQALTWSGGKSAKIMNSTFAYTGLRNGQLDTDPSTISPSAVNGSIGTNVDFESATDPIRDGVFEDCKIVGNFGTSASVVIHTNVDNVSFNNCTIKGFENSDPGKGRSFFSISMGGDLTHRNFVFNGCTIRGVIDFSRQAPLQTNDGLTKFLNCDIATNNVAISERYYSLLYFLYDKVLFDKCQIRSTNLRALMEIMPRFGLGTLNNPDDYVTFNNCSFTSEYDGNIDGLPAVLGNIRFARFTGNTKITHAAGPGSEPYNSRMQATILNGSNLISPMNSFQFANHYYYWCYTPEPAEATISSTYPYIFGETPCEYLNVYIGDGATNAKSYFSNFLRPFYIGEGTTLTVRSGSALVLSGNIYLAGKIVVEAGAYLWYGNNPTIHYLGSTTLASHIVLQAGAITSIPPPFVYSFSSTSTYTAHSVNLRSQLMAPNEYLRSAVIAERLKYDNPNIKCQKCQLVTSSRGTQTVCLSSSISGGLHPLSGVGQTSGLDYIIGSDEEYNITIYPNPTNDEIRVVIGNQNETSEIQLLDINGRQLYKTTSKEAEVKISLSKYQQGTYLVRVSNATNSVVKKVVKTN